MPSSGLELRKRKNLRSASGREPVPAGSYRFHRGHDRQIGNKPFQRITAIWI